MQRDRCYSSTQISHFHSWYVLGDVRKNENRVGLESSINKGGRLEGPSRRSETELRPHESQELSTQKSGKKLFQAEGTASAKTMRREWHGSLRSVWLGLQGERSGAQIRGHLIGHSRES